MAAPTKRTASRNSEGPKKTTTTKPKATGVVLEVSNPMDLWYLCEKVGYARLYPFYRTDGMPMYQRVVTQLIRRDSEAFRYLFPYAGEVGYDMTKSPPEPVMSRREPHRPSEFPLSQYRAIKQGADALLGPVMVVEEVLVSTAQLEGVLSPEGRSGQLQPAMSGKGLMRIPDVIRVADFALSGKAKFSQANIHCVIEVKFDGDRLTDDQREAYLEIAGNINNFRLLQTKTCDGRKSRTRDWIRSAAKEPAYVPVGQAMKKAAMRRNGMPFVSEYQLLVDRIDHEHEEVRRTITPQSMLIKESQTMRAAPSAEEERRRLDAQERTRNAVGVLASPFVGATAIVVAAPIVFGGGTAMPVVTARTGAQIIQFPRVLRPMVAGAAAATASYKIAAEPMPEQAVTLESLPTAYLYWPD